MDKSVGQRICYSVIVVQCFPVGQVEAFSYRIIPQGVRNSLVWDMQATLLQVSRAQLSFERRAFAVFAALMNIFVYILDHEEMFRGFHALFE